MMKSWDYNYHSHTARCGHALGDDEEYVLSAVKAGFKKMGFSDHVFIPNYEQPGMRGSYKELDNYLHSIDVLRRRYKGLIDIYAGFEAEYSPLLEPYYKELKESGKVDYLIQGQHSYFENDHMIWYTRKYSVYKEIIEAYVKDCIAGMRSGLFLYLAHPDFFLIFARRFDEVGEWAANEIAKVSLETGVPLEVNMAHARFGIVDSPSYHDYPCHDFWDIVSRYGCKVVLGVDAHTPEEYTHTRYDVFASFIKEHSLNLIEPVVEHSKLHR